MADETANIRNEKDAALDAAKRRAARIEGMRPLPEVLAHFRTDYSVAWSDEEQQHVGQCAGFPDLKCLAGTPRAALTGIKRVVAEAIANKMVDGKPIPPTR